MTKDIWLNLPVKDVKKSREFFRQIGFTKDTAHGNSEVSAGFFVSEKKVVVMLFAEAVFKNIVQHDVTDAHKTSEFLISIDAESRAEVDELAKKAEAAGGNVFAKPAESQGWLYGCGFADLDGHRWNVLFMDMAKMPK